MTVLDGAVITILRVRQHLRSWEGRLYFAFLIDVFSRMIIGWQLVRASQKTFGEHGLELTRGVFAAWRAYQHEHHDRDRLGAEITPIQTQLRQLLEDASPKSKRTRWHRRFANNLLKVWPPLWTFTTIEGIEPTNNPAERALRGPVIHRKLSLGTQSNSRERFAERALTAVATCRLQHRSLFTYLSELIVQPGDPFPDLA
jgi:hypothetical protein